MPRPPERSFWKIELRELWVGSTGPLSPPPPQALSILGSSPVPFLVLSKPENNPGTVCSFQLFHQGQEDFAPGRALVLLEVAFSS